MNYNDLWPLLTIVGLACTLICGFPLRKSFQALRAACPGFQPPQLAFGYKAAQVQAQVEAMDETFLNGLRLFSKQLADTLVGVWMLMLVVSRNCTSLPWLMAGMMGASALAFLFAVLETAFVRRGSFLAASICSRLKWGVAALWTIGMFAGLFIRSTAL